MNRFSLHLRWTTLAACSASYPKKTDKIKMANIGNLNKKLTDLAALEKLLWDAFIQSEKEYTPSPLCLRSTFQKTRKLNKAKILEWYYNYPILLLVAISFALGSLFYNWLLVGYLVVLFFAFTARDRFMHAFAVEKLGTQSYTNYGFGLQNLSLAAVGVLKLRDTGGVKLTKESIGSIVKIVKSSHEHSEVSYGIGDQLKKSLFATPIPVVYYLLENHATLVSFATGGIQYLKNNLFAAAFIICLILGALLFCYELLLGQTRTKRRKRKYILLLNIIAESFV